jgi:potassium/hydrogen antiporter
VSDGRLLLLVGTVLLLAVAAAYAANRVGVPLLVAFLGLGMLLGSEGPGGIFFDDPDLARTVGIAGLVVILFEGGLTSAWRGIRPVLLPAALLGTAGVVITAVIAGAAAYVLFDLSPAQSLLLGAVVGSTDAAAVFATLRFTTLRRRLARVLEAESGVNDPMAVALTIGLIEWLTEPDPSFADFLVGLVQQFAIGLVVGLAIGAVAARAFARLPTVVEPFAPVASLATAAVAFGAADVIHGSGFLSVYIVGLFLGNTRASTRRAVVAFHQGLAFLAQVVLFVVLGLLVFPSELVDVILPGLALAAVLIFLARPAAVWTSTAFQGFTHRERALLGWAGLRGAVPIVLATFAPSAGIAASDTIFNGVFFVVVVSALLQETTLEQVARRLGLALPVRRRTRPPIEVDAAIDLELVDFMVAPESPLADVAVRDIPFPRDALVAVIVRGDESVPPRGSTVIRANDRLYVIAPSRSRRALDRVLAGRPPGG